MKNQFLTTAYVFKFVVLACFFATTASADIVFVSDDTTLLNNGTPTAADSADGEASFGGRDDVILGFNGANPRHGLFRFDVSSLATQINDPTLRVVSAQFLINEIDSANFDLPTATFSVFPVVAGNSGWLEGISATSTAGFDGDGNASFTYHTSPTGSATNTNGRLWFSDGGGVTGVTDPFPDGFTFGTDTGSSLGSGSITPLDNGMNDLLSIDLDPTTIESLLVDWLADTTGNAGIAIQAAGSDPISFESSELGTGGYGRLDVTFAAIPEPTGFALLAGCSIVAGLRRRRK